MGRRSGPAVNEALVSAAATAVGAAIGGGAAVLASFIAARAQGREQAAAWERQNSAEEAQWVRRRQSERNDLQRSTLLEAQEALVALGRATGRVHVADYEAQKASGNYGGHLLPEDVDQEAHQTNVRAMLLISRILDEVARNHAAAARNRYIDATLVDSEAEAHRQIQLALKEHSAFDARLTELLADLW